MKQNGFLEIILTRCEELESSTFKTYIFSGLIVFTIITIFSLYQIQSAGKSLKQKIRSNQKIVQHASNLIERRESVQEKEKTFAELVKTRELKEGIVPFLGKFMQQHGINAETGWQETLETIAIPNNKEFDEKRVRISFRGQTTEQMVNLMEGLRREPVVMIREINVKREMSTLSLELLIATRATTTRT